MAIACPHCGAFEQAAAFCTRCGKAIAAGGAPRILGKDELATSQAGRSLQSDALAKQERKAAITLFVIAGLQLVIGGIVLAIGMSNPDAAPGGQFEGVNLAVAGVTILVIGGIFLGLGFWARRSPLPAAITGLVLFITLHLLDALVDPTALARGIIIKIIVILALVNAIQAGIKHRKLKQQMQAA